MVKSDQRKREGKFFTPFEWAAKAHEMISESFGGGWKDDFVVWDCACGEGNLTRGYRFKELYCSTLIQSELDTMISDGVNPEAEKFVFDFLNDDLDDSGIIERDSDRVIPAGLIAAFEAGKDVMFLINPPYGTAGEFTTVEGKNKAGIGITAVNAMMAKDDLGPCRAQLYAQFLYRIDCLRKQYGNRVVIATFLKPNFMTGQSFKKFRKKILSQYGLVDGMVFQASNFDDVSGNWGASFTIFDSAKPCEGLEEFPHRIAIGDKDGITFCGTKLFYNLDNSTPASVWVREPIKGLKTYDAPQMSSGLKVKQDGRGRSVAKPVGYMLNHTDQVGMNQRTVALFSEAFSGGNGVPITPANADRAVALFAARDISLGFMHNNANCVKDNQIFVGLYSESFSSGGQGLPVTPANANRAVALFAARDINLGYMYNNTDLVAQNEQTVALFSEACCRGIGVPVTPANFERVLALFAARRVESSWLIDADEYSAPNENHPDYPQFVADAYVYSLFNKKSNQSSLRQVLYKGLYYDIPNQFFWRTREDVMRLATEHEFDACYQDACDSPDRFVATLLPTLTLSPEAQAVLDAANAIYEASFKFRKSMHGEDDSLHLHAWDAGWYQIKRIAKVHLKDELVAFNKLYAKLTARMTRLTYEVGFLRKSISI